jgi:hypothetical protein
LELDPVEVFAVFQVEINALANFLEIEVFALAIA